MGKKILILSALLLMAAGPAMANRLQGPESQAAGSNPRGVAAADLDGDGFSDAVVANFGAGTLIGQATKDAGIGEAVVYKGSATGLVRSQTLATGLSPRGVAIADLNGDSRPDIVITNYDENSLSVFLQNADHTFAPGVRTPAGTHPVGVAIASPYGEPLVAAANYDSDNISLFKAGRNGLELMQTVPAGSKPTDVAFFQPNSGKTSLVIANFMGNSLSVYPVEASGVGTGMVIPVSGNPCKVDQGDFNQDGQTDLVVALFSENQVAVIAGTPAGLASEARKTALTGLRPNGLAVGRLTGAPEDRIITSNRDSDTLDLLGRAEDGVLKVLTTLSVKEGEKTDFGPVEVCVADFNGDKRADALLTHMRTGTIKVFYQLTPDRPVVTSSTHPDQEKWVAAQDAEFSFEAPADVDGIAEYAYLFDQNASSEPGDSDSRVAAPPLMFKDLETGQYYFHIRAIDRYGNLGLTAHYKIGVTAEMSVKNVYNYPNPSRTGRTTLRFPLTEQAQVSVRIYDEVGNLVWSRELSPGETVAGVNQVVWEGINDRGAPVANGGYIMKVSANGKTITKKIAIVR